MEGWLVSGHGAGISSGNPIVVGMLSFHVVAVGANEPPPPVLRHLGEGWLKLPSLLDDVRNSSVESSFMARYGVDAPLQVELTKMTPSLPLLVERLRPPK
jgi:hypothetical protein